MLLARRAHVHKLFRSSAIVLQYFMLYFIALSCFKVSGLLSLAWQSFITGLNDGSRAAASVVRLIIWLSHLEKKTILVSGLTGHVLVPSHHSSVYQLPNIT